MGRKRIEARIKKEAVEAVKSGKLTQSEASRRLGVGRTSIRSWISRKKTKEKQGLKRQSKTVCIQFSSSGKQWKVT